MDNKLKTVGFISVCAGVVALGLWASGVLSREKKDEHAGHGHGAGEAHSSAEDGHEDHGEEGDEHEGDWCAEHNTPESACTRCDSGLIAKFKANGDWCAEHNLPESHCAICNPDAGRRLHVGHGDDCGDDDLDRLTKKNCEHGGPILDCNECRYQTGVVKVDASLAKSLLSTTKAKRGAVTKTLKLTGTVALDPTRTVEVVPKSGGVVASVQAFLGDRVKQDDVLAVIRSSELGEAKAAFLEADAVFGLAKRSFEREKKLREQGFSSEAEYLDAEKEQLSTAAHRSAAEKKLFVMGLTKARIDAIRREKGEAGFGDLTLRSPSAGTLIFQNIAEGKYVENIEHLYTVADLSRVWVWCDLYERDLGAMHAELATAKSVTVDVLVRAFPDTRFRGRIDLIGSTLDEHTRTAKVRVRVLNKDGRLKPGMFATVIVRLSAGSKVLSVPSSAVMKDEDKAFVFQKWQKEFWVRRDVEVAAVGDGITEIASGLDDGAIVVTGGAFMLKSDVLRMKMGAG